MKTKSVFTSVVLLSIVALLPLLASGPAASVLAADPPSGGPPPVVDGLLDASYEYDGRTDDPNTPGKLYHYRVDPTTGEFHSNSA